MQAPTTTAEPIDKTHADDDAASQAAENAAEEAHIAARLRHIALIGAGIAACFPVLALIGKVIGFEPLSGFGTNNPMAPTTAFALLLFCGALYLKVRGPDSQALRWTVWISAALVAAMGLTKLLEPITRVQIEDILLEALGKELPKRKEGTYMSPVTAGGLFLFGLALMGLRRRSCSRSWLVVFSTTVVILTNLWVLLGYLEKDETTLFKDFLLIVAPSTALAFLFLAPALIAAEGSTGILLQPLIGGSTRAMLLRSFLPVSTIMVLLAGIVRSDKVYKYFEELIPVTDLQLLLYPFLSVVSIAVVYAVVAKIAGTIGSELDEAEKARRHALEEMRQARDDAEEANRAKSQFLANMSHELRTPLNSVIGYSEMLLEETEERGLVELQPDLRRIHESGRHLLNLINDILDLSKIAAGKVELYAETFDLKARVLDIANTVRPLVEKNGNTLLVVCPDDLGTIHTDLTRLKQCLLNLLSNAGKFTEKGRVTLRVRREIVEGHDWVCFDVIDTGIGMGPEQMQKIFKPFVQADSSTTRRFGGTGLGLTVSLSFSQLMGGTIQVESAAGQGSTFTLKVPAVYQKAHQGRPTLKPRIATTMPAHEHPLATNRPKILVVDDDLAVQDMLNRLLSKEGYEVILVSRGEDVLRLAREQRPAAITLDVMMPGMDGWSVLAALKADPHLANIPVIMLTIVDDKNLGYALGAVDYLVKPVDHNRILSILHNHCQGGPKTGRLALVVEDDPGTREMLRRTLEGDGWVVAEAANGRQALEQIGAQKPALILLDLMMPEMDGFEFLEELRHKPEWQSIPVVVVTARDLTAEDRMFLTGAMFLGGCVKRVLQKGTYRREELLQEARALVAAQSGRNSTEPLK